MRRRAAALGALAVIATWTHTRAAHAGDHTRAVELFEQGQALAHHGQCAEAIPKFIETLAIEPSIGALLNLGACHEKTGTPDLAWKRFREAERLARSTGDDRAEFARARAVALEPLLPRLLVEVPATSRGDGLSVHIDDETMDGAQWGTPHVVVSGQHVVSATMPGHEPWQTVVLATGQSTRTVTVPALPTTHVLGAGAGVGEWGVGRGSTQRIVGVVVAGAGAAGVVLGGVFGGVALARKSDAQALQSGPSPSPFDAAKADAQGWAAASTVAFIAGAALLAGGLALWLTAPTREPSVVIAPAVDRYGAGIAARFTF